MRFRHTGGGWLADDVLGMECGVYGGRETGEW